MKKSVIIIVLVFAVIAVVLWLVIGNSKGNQSVTKRTESTGLTNFFANAKDGLVKSLFTPAAVAPIAPKQEA